MCAPSRHPSHSWQDPLPHSAPTRQSRLRVSEESNSQVQCRSQLPTSVCKSWWKEWHAGCNAGVPWARQRPVLPMVWGPCCKLAKNPLKHSYFIEIYLVDGLPPVVIALSWLHHGELLWQGRASRAGTQKQLEDKQDQEAEHLGGRRLTPNNLVTHMCHMSYARRWPVLQATGVVSLRDANAKVSWLTRANT